MWKLQNRNGLYNDANGVFRTLSKIKDGVFYKAVNAPC